MTELNALEQRIATALNRIDKGLDGWPGPDASPSAAPEASAAQVALDDERIVTAQLSERLRAVKEKYTEIEASLNARVAQMTQQLDAQGAELKRMRNTNVQLREVLRILREASANGMPDPHLLNRAMLAELDALRVTRLGEMAEMDEILAELAPLIEEVREDA